MKKVLMEDIGEFKFLSEISYSPNGERAAFVMSRADIAENCYKSTIWLLENDKCRKLTSAEKESSFLWLDDQNIIFPGDRKKVCKPNETLYNKINIFGGEAEEFMIVPAKVSKIKPISEDKFLICSSFDHYAIDISNLEGVEREKALAQIEENKDYEVFDELPFWSNGRGVVNKKRTRLYLFDKNSREMKLLSPDFMNVGSFDYDKKSNKVVYCGNDYQWIDERNSDIYIRNLQNDEQVKVKIDGKLAVNSVFWLDDKVVFAGSDHAIYGTAQNPSQFIADPISGDFYKFADLDCSMGSTVGTDCSYGGGKSGKIANNAWYFSSTRGFNTAVVKLTTDGNEEIVSPDVNGSIDCWDYHNGKFICVAMREGGLQEIYSFDENSKTERKLTSFNDDYLNSHSVSKQKRFNFVDSDGVEIDGWVIEPVDYDPNKVYPAILDVHGGPKTVYGEVFFHEMQLWANRGFFVFFCNPRGGDGKGNAFADIRGKNYGVLDYNDLMEFTDKVIEAYPQIDKSKLYMTGGSYGGFMANWIIGHTNRFAAVASQRSISNFISKCLTTDIGYYHNLSAVQSDPWTSFDEMWNRSPLKYADKCKTPTLFIQSDEDYRCWECDAIQMFTALRMHGCPARLCLFHGENHNLSRNGKPKHRIRRLKEITDWFENPDMRK